MRHEMRLTTKSKHTESKCRNEWCRNDINTIFKNDVNLAESRGLSYSSDAWITSIGFKTALYLTLFDDEHNRNDDDDDDDYPKQHRNGKNTRALRHSTVKKM